MEFDVPPVGSEEKLRCPISIELGKSRMHFYLYIRNPDGSLLMRILLGGIRGTSENYIKFSRATVHPTAIMTNSGHEIAQINKRAFQNIYRQTNQLLNNFEKLLIKQFIQEKNYVPIDFFDHHQAFIHFAEFCLRKAGYVYLSKLKSYVFWEIQPTNNGSEGEDIESDSEESEEEDESGSDND